MDVRRNAQAVGGDPRRLPAEGGSGGDTDPGLLLVPLLGVALNGLLASETGLLTDPSYHQSVFIAVETMSRASSSSTEAESYP